jgi:hypothetical protein
LVPKKLDEYRVPLPSGGDEHPVPRHGTIIDDSAAPDGRQYATRFVHQKISRRKVPVVAVAAGDGDVTSSVREAGKPQRQRAYAGHDRQ